METIEYRTEDKSAWGYGDWQAEPDKKQWQDESTGYPCLIVRNHGGALCGYVGVPEGHPLHGKDYDDVNVDVHGGLTFANSCAEDGDESLDICHKTAGQDRVWWLGFDCAHYLDVIPGWATRSVERSWENDPEMSYKNFAYVTNEVESLARQLKSLA